MKVKVNMKVKVRPVAEKLYQVPPCSGEQEVVGVEQGASVVCKEFLEKCSGLSNQISQWWEEEPGKQRSHQSR